MKTLLLRQPRPPMWGNPKAVWSRSLSKNQKILKKSLILKRSLATFSKIWIYPRRENGISGQANTTIKEASASFSFPALGV
ncbi:hypothetical protein Marshall_200 [Salmonella phage Marshall]|uniref:Uncharacterized protein n=1 Tax=Salmonella phage Marshall TaxID=1406794 RepID=U5PYN8_9CAUD|nr:hypothetical protein Marshall_200 [Salmonella phage Marshall]AGY47717.1 hypothetical protein Marshall_200 [Salmonella phage Marshall]